MSPIRGLTERYRPQRIGKFRLGEKVEKINKKGEKVEYPKALDYFVVTEEVKSIYGDQPRKLDILFPSEDPEDFFPQYYELWGSSSGLKCRGDGIKANSVTKEGGEFQEVECNPDECGAYKNDDCIANAHLKVLFWKVPEAALSMYQIDTRSVNSILNINSSIRLIKSMFGRLTGIPLVLSVKWDEHNPVIGGKRKKTHNPVMYIEYPGSLEDMVKKGKSGELIQALGLPAPKTQILTPSVQEKPDMLYTPKGEVEKVEEELGNDASEDNANGTELKEQIHSYHERMEFTVAKSRLFIKKNETRLPEYLKELKKKFGEEDEDIPPGTAVPPQKPKPSAGPGKANTAENLPQTGELFDKPIF